MMVETLKTIILEFLQEVTFGYQDKHACINPCSRKKFEVEYGDNVKTFNNIDELFSSRFFNGKSLAEIVGDIRMTSL